MADKTKIEWTDASWNPIVGCSIKSPGCKICYAMKDAWRKNFNPKTPQYHGLTEKVNGKPVWTGEVRFVEHKLLEPLSWRKPRMIFVNSMSDLFHEDIPFEWIDRIFAVMILAHQHIYQPLTKRGSRMRDYVLSMPDRKADIAHAAIHLGVWEDADSVYDTVETAACAPLPHIWLGFSAEDQKRFDERWESVQHIAAANWFTWLSGEPLLGPLDITPALWNFPPCDDCPGTNDPDCCHEPEQANGLGWVVVGGESGLGARPMHPNWPRWILRDCKAAGIPFLFKQWGEHAPVGWVHHDSAGVLVRPDGHVCKSRAELAPSDNFEMERVGKKKAGRMLDGAVHDGFPEVAA